MPVYEYCCKFCDKRVEHTKSMVDAGKPVLCPACGEFMVRKFESPALKFVGEGFHCNDY